MARSIDVGVLQRLSELDGPSGFEGPVRDHITYLAGGMADEVEMDRIGNVIARVPGPSPSVMLIAHMDEIGFMVSEVDDDGFIYFTTLGGWDPRLMPGLEVRVMGSKRSLPGTVGMKPPHITSLEERSKVPEVGDLFIDTGLSRSSIERAGVRVGTPMVPATSFRRLSRNRVMGKAFDDRAGCFVLLRLLEEGHLPCDTALVWSVMEELGSRGAGPAVERVDPDYVIVVEGTIAADFPGVPKQKIVSRMGGGPVLTVMDRLAISDAAMVDAAIEEAKARGIPLQLKKPGIGATDAGPIHIRREGYRAIPFAVPSRYIHSPAGVMDLRDLYATEDIVRAMLERIASDGL